MTAHYSVTNAVTVQDQNDINQMVSTFSNTLGVTNTTQDALGRIVLPSAASNPGSPSSFQALFRTDLGIGGRLHIRHSNSQWSPYLPMRQRAASADIAAQTMTSTSLSDVSGLTVTLTTTGGRVAIRLIPTSTTGGATQLSFTNSTTGNSCEIALLEDGVVVNRMLIGAPGASAVVYYPPSAFEWTRFPSAASHTYKIQVSAGGGGSSAAFFGIMIIQAIEYGDA